MMRHDFSALEKRLCTELEEIQPSEKESFGRSRLDDTFKLVYSIKGLRSMASPSGDDSTAAHSEEPPSSSFSGFKASAGEEHLTMDQARDWLSKMKNADGTTGARWSFEAASRLMTQRGISCDPIDFWVTLNMMYSDYSKVAKAYSSDNPNFYSDMAAAFLSDEDAVEDKLVQYWEHIPKV